ncbi:hypothetical protein FG167_08875 [Lacinutrix sp. WUR7]|uniref:hypothetical protein n=1 Tax=Lacinutrix sp. WUR7 TaxID=2653681 RepID=UPI00193EA9C9|nr:hypothetical protein [Lacinutrix sp. WUR7]QRM89343.1 hypothetical protein FG167_08875 [Lacinutrix sp. WUR7]
MKIEHLEERINDYKKSIEIVVEKKMLWETTTKKNLVEILTTITKQYHIGWKVQQLNWINSNEAVNIIFESFPADLISSTNKIPAYQFIPGAALVFSQSYNGDIFVFILFPIIENMPIENSSIDLGILNPKEINEKVIVEKVDEFLKEMIKWDVPSIKNKLGY